MTNEEIRAIAETAYDGSKGAADPAYAELDSQAQNMLFDVAASIVNHGGPTTTFELAVAEAAVAPPEIPIGTRVSKAKEDDDNGRKETKSKK